MNKIKIIHILPSLGYGGISKQLFQISKKIDHDRFIFYYIYFGKKEKYFDEVLVGGSKAIKIPPMRDVGITKFKQTIKRVIKEECNDANIIHIHLNYMSGIVAKWAKEEGIEHRICHIRGTLIEGKKKLLLPIFKYYIKKYCNYYMAVSKDSGSYYYGKKQKFTVLNNGLDFERYNNINFEDIRLIKDKYSLDKFDTIILQVGRLSHEKNHLFSIDLMCNLRKNDINAVLLIAGEGEQRNNIEEYSLKRDIADRVVMLGNVEDIWNYYYLCSFSILPSLSEGMPNVVLQSQCANRRCFVNDNITKDVDLGCDLVHFCRINDLNDWTNKILESESISTNKIEKNQIYEAMKKKNFLVENTIETLENIYKEMSE